MSASPAPQRHPESAAKFADPQKVQLVLNAVAVQFGTTVIHLIGRRRDEDSNGARQAVCILLAQVLDLSNSEIGRILDGRNHSTIAYARARLTDLLRDGYWREAYQTAHRNALISLEMHERRVVNLGPETDGSDILLTPVQIAAYDQLPVVISAISPDRRRCRIQFAGDPPEGLTPEALVAAETLAPPPKLNPVLDDLEHYAQFWRTLHESGLAEDTGDQYHRALVIQAAILVGGESGLRRPPEPGTRPRLRLVEPEAA